MILVNDPANFPASLRPTVVTIGKFDGLHCGHRDLIARVRQEYAEARLWLLRFFSQEL